MNASRILTVVLSLIAVALVFAPSGVAAPPLNDAFTDAAPITSLPFSNVVAVGEATTEPGEPLAWGQSRTVWYAYTPTSDVTVRADLNGSDYVTAFMSIYRQDGSGFGGLTWVAGGTYGSSFTFELNAGTAYYIQQGDSYQYGWVSTIGINLQAVLPPLNDNFVAATPFSSVPFSASFDLTAATTEQGEPFGCAPGLTKSVWYAFTPTATGSYGGDPGVSNVNVYTGSSLPELTNVACSQWWGLAFHAEVGTTYYLQVRGGGLRLNALAPPPADYRFSPADPSTFDETAFSYWNGGYWDPTVTGWTWDFGDGTTASGERVSHRFASDGDHDVTLTVMTVDGRRSSVTRPVRVRTHDVAILTFTTPSKGKVGKHAPVTVEIGNTRYPESVQVDLYRVTTQGDVLVGTSVQTVGVMKPKSTVSFSFGYAFTNEDAEIGKLPFKAVASIQGARDSVPGDNMVTSPPTLIAR